MTLVPTLRGIAVVGAALMPCAVALAATPGSAPVLGVVVLALALVFGVDAARAQGTLDGVTVALPDVARFTRGAESVVLLTIEQSAPRERVLHLGVKWPVSFAVDDDTVRVRMPRDTEAATIAWKVTPSERGVFSVEHAYLGVASPFGLWAYHRATPAPSSLRVYPNLQQERKALASLFLNRDAVGIHARAAIGKGREFEQLREYMPGDSFEDIDWKATARRGEPITKTYRVERTQEVYVVIDTSRLSGMTTPAAAGEPPVTHLERCIQSALVLGLVAERQGDLFGVLTFDARVNHFLKARNGRTHYNACRDAIHAIKPSDDNPDFAELFSFLRVRLRKRALLVVLTNLSDPLLADRFIDGVDLIARNHLVLVATIADPEVRPLFSEADVATVDDIYRRLGGHFEWLGLEQTKRTLHLHNVALHSVPHPDLSAELVGQYMDRKQRQLL